MKSKKIFVAMLVFTMFILGISPHSANVHAETQFDEQAELLEMLSDENDPYIKLLDEMPMEIAEQGTIPAAKWLNENNTELKGEFVADSEFVKFIPSKSDTFSTLAVSGACVWAVTKAIGMNFIPWAKLLKVKSVAKSFGGIAQLTKLVYTSYKHQRNLGLGQKNAIRKAVQLVLKSKNFGASKVEAVYQLFELDDVIKDCF